jgi:hypothetical protein
MFLRAELSKPPSRSMTTLEDVGIVIRKRDESLQILSGSDSRCMKPWTVTG